MIKNQSDDCWYLLNKISKIKIQISISRSVKSQFQIASDHILGNFVFD